MATLNLDENQATYQVRAYQPGLIRINQTEYTHSLILTRDQLIKHWSPQTSAEITLESLSPIVKLKPDILLIGTGSQLTFLPVEVYGELINLGIGVEVMNTSAACRTYNALTAENRHVAAALIVS